MLKRCERLLDNAGIAFVPYGDGGDEWQVVVLNADLRKRETSGSIPDGKALGGKKVIVPSQLQPPSGQPGKYLKTSTLWRLARRVGHEERGGPGGGGDMEKEDVVALMCCSALGAAAESEIDGLVSEEKGTMSESP